MSQWTHLAGIIRLDNMDANIVNLLTEVKKDKITEAVVKALGQTCNYDSSLEQWDRCGVPMGSEGSLQYAVFPNSDGDEHSLSWGYIPIWGDLRDFGNEKISEIQDWFQKSLERLLTPEGFGPVEGMSLYKKADYMLSSFMIRDAVLSVDVEYSPPIIFLWDDDKKQVVKTDSKLEEA